MSHKVHFSVRYDGPAVADHTMDVREVSDSLMALSELVEVGQALTCPDAPSATLKIEGNFKRGSFGIDLIANMSVPEQLALLLTGQKATAIANSGLTVRYAITRVYEHKAVSPYRRS